MDIPKLGVANNLFKQALSDSVTTQEQLFQKLSERFLHLAQNILCNREAAVEVSNKALERIQNEYRELSSHENPIKWTQKVLDNEIENYFQALVAEISAGSKKSEEQLFNILNKRFLLLAFKRISWDKENMAANDANDIVQNALLTVSQKFQTAQPHGTFIQWAQTIFNYKYLEYRRKQRRKSEGPLIEKDETTYIKTLSEVAIKRRKVAAVNETGVESSQRNTSGTFENDPFENDPYRWDPILLTESSELKKNLLAIIQNMGEQCKRVFRVLFSEGDRKSMREEFPDKTPEQIYVIVSRCRKELKEKALKGGIL